jgi:hypothetical protein
MSKTALSLLAVMGLFAGASSAWAQSQPAGSWPSQDAFDTGIGFTVGGSASDGTYLYVLGGYFSGTTSFRRYDPVTDGWEDLDSLPEDNVYFRAAHAGDHIYILGNGYYGNGEIYRYDTVNRFWEWVGTLENGRYSTGAASFDGKIYIAGGYDPFNGGNSTTLEVFDPADLSLTTLADMPQGLQLPMGAAVPENGRIYFAGGSGNNGDSSACLEYDPETDSWATRASISNGSTTQTRYYPGGFALNGRLYVVGGYMNGYQSTTLEYTPSTNTWAQRASMNFGRYGHASGVIGGFGYVYGGESNSAWYRREKFVPPDFGLPPNLPETAAQVGSQAESSQQGGWTNTQMIFHALVTDPNGGQQVRLEVQVRPSNSQTWGPLLTSGNGAQGLRSITYTIASNGSYDWRWRVADVLNNYAPMVNGVPGWVEAFGNTVSPDFNSDQILPAVPVALSPGDTDIQVASPASGPVTLTWIESTDNGPVSAISYEIQVAFDGGFNSIEAQLFSTAGNDSLVVPLSVSSFNKFWRLRARDVGGNFSPWSNIQTFRVTFNDGVDHAGGDGDKNCGFAAAALGSLPAALLGLALLAFAGRKGLGR